MSDFHSVLSGESIGLMIKIQYYKTDNGIVVSGVDPKNIGLPIINGIQSRKSFNEKWIIVDGISNVESIAYKLPDLQVNKRYVRRENSPESLPEIIWAGEKPDYFESVRDLYEVKTDLEPQPNKFEEFEAEFLGEFKMASLGDPTTFRFTLSKQGFDKNEPSIGYESIFNYYPFSDNHIQVDDIVKSVAPEFAWHLYPCSVSSDIAYRIIRYHISRNIDGKYAKITSDYDFCFAVCKLVPVQPWINKHETLSRTGKSYKPPRFTERKVTHKEEKIFEMTPLTKKYGDYTVVDGFSGESLEDLRLNIVNYLDSLMEVINKPIELCEKCCGKGFTENIKLETNKR